MVSFAAREENIFKNSSLLSWCIRCLTRESVDFIAICESRRGVWKIWTSSSWNQGDTALWLVDLLRCETRNKFLHIHTNFWMSYFFRKLSCCSDTLYSLNSLRKIYIENRNLLRFENAYTYLCLFSDDLQRYLESFNCPFSGQCGFLYFLFVYKRRTR